MKDKIEHYTKKQIFLEVLFAATSQMVILNEPHILNTVYELEKEYDSSHESLRDHIKRALVISKNLNSRSLRIEKLMERLNKIYKVSLN